ncbi:MAG: [FeFe] hydrogenase H-cluster radical SAM maturase HydE [Clostridiales bacterium]|nr:[FeFe] hydrogenase H-cluster radical SAM maturase HydE [Clostridiales bacterium]
MEETVNRLRETNDLDDEALLYLIQNDECNSILFKHADSVRREIYGDKVYIRGLIELTNYCKNNCLYCGIRRDNKSVGRYRLSKEQVLLCCEQGYELGFRTFVMQGGEDPYFSDDVLCDIISDIKNKYPDCAVTLSLGERSRESYKLLFKAGADRYLLRHETADKAHYEKLHPNDMSFDNRIKCLYDLKETGFQVGAGFMVGSPFQTYENIIADLRFLQKLKPHMVGIGPFISHCQTPFAGYKNGDTFVTLRLLSIIRLMLPNVLLPSTTALSTIHPDGRILGLKAGANVVMPNLSPKNFRSLYSLYDGKAAFGAESAQELEKLKEIVSKAGYSVCVDRGDVKK